MNELQKRFKVGLDEVFEDSQSYVGVMSPEDHLFESVLSFTLDFFQAEITDMLDRLRLEKQEYEPDYPIPNTDTVEGYNSAVDDLNNKIEREK
jgi:hypothetical protein